MKFRFSRTTGHSTFTTSPSNIFVIKMWILLAIWIIYFVDGKTINECRLVLHAVTTVVCQLYLALLPVRYATVHFANAVWHFLIAVHNTDEKCCIGEHNCSEGFRNSAIYYLEGLCLCCESVLHLLAVVSTLCVGVRHFLQGVLFLILSTMRWAQQMLLSFKEDVDEWDKEQKRKREASQKLREQVEEYLSEYCQEPITSLKPQMRKNHAKKK
ncbi:uncharacterized protein LOC127415696 [Myxocyprinus asiaticus]|uniref:uncharacterized protein LOC127415696 n=1 Tax=Myxocyprinus asiaticus TaxID=70543 RepID=UPI0022214305|nr:uncharacterized protein LOC127415696 [Myxocyprinus asiaticus]